MRAKTLVSAAIVVLAAALLVVILWPTEDPLANVNTVAIQPPDWERTDPGQAVRVPFMDGLTVTLGKRDIRIVTDPKIADAVLVVRDVRLEGVEFRLESGQIAGRVSATCVLTELRTGHTRVMDFSLELRNGAVRATLAARRFWQFWKRG